MTEDPDSRAELPPLRDIIARHGLDARKALGQHFLLDLNLTRRIARAAGDLGRRTVIEVGPGPGGLTRALLEQGGPVIVIEKDRRCVAALEELGAAFPGQLTIIEADALTVDMATLGERPRWIVSNLPYNISTALLLRWLHGLSGLDGLVLMFQKEVADRLWARPGLRGYSRLSVITQWLCEVKPLFDVNPRAFTPPPKVNSAVVRLTPRPSPLVDVPIEAVERATATLFGQRRKMVRAPLKALGDPGAICEACDIDPTQRAEQLPVETILKVAALIAGRGTTASEDERDANPSTTDAPPQV
ncbi:16S rRNA (adenine(1518)-N(6)/adenine(1519)-N(6))-dimethyltransferase RsmA [Roseospira marina]|uniref:Ribosomal RNA small subunit methyltransferase A n=1 Tax=Roseospira marina TaxID=140057 RepID=A0A5M6IGB6_9PROT|nr:16S rRNA (adenine(1518)-N(6)/adenine(1519)-N(6))-dimethyltransferase RsmA [Roseospira marina]KAA5607351.1 16S rRNA (adenine(1518)-N(6)/adenine(1519)-N(6))-dimethyltransferase RsmA [Roseospira marina]MBB4312483.1 16S rRNA (adenine1518-N6/adenine1519-N6)-dimethyltransferase [Roseospira marina]MBB5085501.1 16S rRNA (adenine1518-N6/adenine1519-N6)-dimethyltransferase [Roseospira marina]